MSDAVIGKAREKRSRFTGKYETEGVLRGFSDSSQTRFQAQYIPTSMLIQCRIFGERFPYIHIFDFIWTERDPIAWNAWENGKLNSSHSPRYPFGNT